ncbi:heavy metal transporter [Streptomyces sp. NPDC127108]|uniref:heavy metal transporter n=1 Tax=Streptomyces sp. NPDC127108 TaxID=3345361 RepID=UPI003625EAE0
MTPTLTLRSSTLGRVSGTVASARRGRLPRIGTAVAVLLAVVAYGVLQYVSGEPEPRCAVASGDGDGATYELSAEQAVNASTVAAVGTRRGMPERAVTIALATALQESGLHNIRHGDRDSLGLFQQRPSQGWGTRRQVMDPVYAAGRFYARLDEVPGYSRLPLTVAAQRVQRSGFPQAYAKHEPDAALLAAALTGRAPAALTCEGRPGTDPGGPDRVRRALVRDFGADVLPKGALSRGGAAEGGVVRVPVPDVAAGPDAVAPDGGAPRRGWELAHWAVAHASALRIERVSYAGREWRAGGDGYGTYTPSTGDSADSSSNSGDSAESVDPVDSVDTGHGWRKKEAGPQKSEVSQNTGSDGAANDSGAESGGVGAGSGPAGEVRIVTGQ